jgi:hypothetical protein
MLSYHVPDTDERAIHDFYAQRLPASGWKCLNKDLPFDVQARQGNRSVAISSLSSGGEAAGVQMVISVSTYSKGFPASCESQSPGADALR